VQSTAAPTAAVNAITALSADSGDTTDFITNQASQTVTGTFTGTLALGETIQVSADGGTTWVTATVTGQTWTATGVTLGNGAGQLITQTLSAGGAYLAGSDHNYTLDTATTAPSFALSTGSTLSGQSVINGTSEPDATVTVTIDPDNNAGTNNSFSYTVTANGSGVWSVNLATAQPSTGTASFSSGTAGVSAVQTDVAGNPSTATTATFTSSNVTSYSVLGPTDTAGAQLLDANNVVLGVDEGAGVIRFVVLRSGDTSVSGTVTYTTQNGSASAGSDYTATSGTVTFAIGETFKIITVNIADDATLETNETVNLQLTAATNGNITTSTATVTINDNEQSVWSVASAGGVDEAAGFITYTVTRTGATGAATINFSTGGGSATAGSDYTAIASQTLSFAAGETSKTVQVAITNDTLAEGNETVVGTISGASTGVISTGTASAAIVDNDQSNWRVSSAGNVDESAGFITYTVTRTGATGAATIDFSTGGGSATAGSDYTAIASQTLTFAAGETSKTVQVAITNDTEAEGNETVGASISGASTGAISTGTATATILDNEQSIWSVDSAGPVNEASGFLTFTVTRTGASAAATIDFGTTGGTATGGVDYTATTQTLSFAAGEMSKTVQVALLNNGLPEDEENVVVSLTNASVGTIATATVTETILDDDQMNWSVASAGDVDEGAGFITYVVSRTGLSSTATVQFETAGGSATAGSDYTALSQSLTFAAGEMSKTVRVAIADDNAAEGNETVVASISNLSQGNNTSNPAVATIIDNDQSNWSVASVGSVDEGAGFITYTVTRTGASAQATINFSTAGGTATAGVSKDYTAANQTLTFAAGEMSKTIQVAINDDNVAEGNETVVGSISSASAGNITTNTATATINDNDQSLWSVSSQGTLMDEGVGFLVYTISRTGSTGAADIDFATAGGTANPVSDYTATNQTLRFAAGEMTKTVKVAIVDDNVAEDNESLNATISNATAGSIVTGTTSASILDNDQSIWRVTSGAGSTIDEGSGYIAYTVSRTGDASASATITFATSGTATAGSDYTAANQTLTFLAGERSKVILVAVTDDGVAEGDETLTALITNNATGNIGNTSVSVTIQDNDQSNWSVASAGTVDEGAGFITYTVTRTGASAAAHIDFTTAGGTATAGADYTAMAQRLSFAAGEMSQTVRVAVNDDALKEGNETVVASIGNADTGNITTNTVSATINDNDQTLWSVNAAGIEEGAGYISYVITRSGNTSALATIDFDTIGGGATPGVDFVAVHRNLSFAAGETTQTVLVQVIDDSVIEKVELVAATISNASSGTLTQATAVPSITDNDLMSWFVNTQGTVGTVDEGAGFISFTVGRNGDASQTASITFSTVGGTAIAGSDYTAKSETLTFAAGENLKTVLVAITNDAILEGNETVVGVLANASAGQIGTTNATANIVDNDQSVWSVSTADVSEGAGFITYTITRSGATTGTASIDFRTAGGTAAQGVDYTGESQTLTFAAGESTKTVLVAVTNDTLAEATDETVVGVIANATSGTIATASAAATITDNDFNVWSVAAAGTGGAESGSRRFTVTRTDGSATGTVDFLTTSNSAREGVDYTPEVRTLTFAVGETSQIVLVSTLEDAQIEATEQVYGYLLNPSSGMVSAGAAFPSIADDDATRVEFSIAVTTDNVAESAGFVAYTITRSGLTSGSDSVDWSVVSGGTATVGTDYTTASGTVTFAAGQTQKVVWVPLVNDGTAEGSETLIVGLSNASKGAITTTTATATLVDDDTPASGNTYAVAAIANNSIESAGSIGYTITRSGDLTQTSTSYFRTNGGTAQTDGSDYVVNAGQTLSWAIGETQKVVFVQLVGDSVVEGNETIIGQSATDSGYTTGVADATATLVDDDVTAATNAYAVTFGNNNILEGNSYAVFTITRSGDLTQASTSYFKTTDNTALAASDYTAIASQTLNWVAGETTKQVAVQLTNDSNAEGAETINGVSSALADFSVQTSVTATIQDDDTWTATAGVNDTLTTQTASGTYTGGFIIDTGDGNDAVTMGAVNQFSFTNIQLGSGNDSLTTNGIVARLLTAGAHYDGGSGVDTIAFTLTNVFNFIGANGATTGDMFKNFEILSMSGGSNQTINLSLSDVLEMTTGNAVADTLRITGNAGDKLNLQALGKTLGTLAAGTGNLTDVDGTTYNVVASTAGNASANDVTIGGATYDVYQYNYDSHLVTLLVATAITTTVI